MVRRLGRDILSTGCRGMEQQERCREYYGDCAAFACGAYQWTSSDEQFDPQEKLKEINGDGSSDTSDSGKYFDWDAENEQFKIKEEGKLYFAYYALNYKTNQYYYVGSFVANLKNGKTTITVEVNGAKDTLNLYVGDDDWEDDDL